MMSMNILQVLLKDMTKEGATRLVKLLIETFVE